MNKSTFRILAITASAAVFMFAGALEAAARTDSLVTPAGVRADDSTRKAALATMRIITGEVNQTGEFQGRESGSGVIISPKGLVITSRHVIVNQKSGRIHSQIWAGLVDPRNEFAPPNRALRLKLIAEDQSLDLALLQITPRQNAQNVTYPHVQLGSTEELSYGSLLTLVGFPAAGGVTTTAVRASVVGLDESQGWIKVEGSMMQGASGGGAINERGELVGVPVKVVADQAVPFFGDNDALAGVVTLGAVGFIRSVEAISEFLTKVADQQAQPAVASSAIQVGGVLLEKGTHNPISGAIVAVLSPNTATPQGLIQQHELLAYSNSEFKGGFKLNRKLRPGKYIFKVIHPNFQTLIQEFTVTANAADLEIELARGQ
jgi:S1-C subfamily serine protease